MTGLSRVTKIASLAAGERTILLRCMAHAVATEVLWKTMSFPGLVDAVRSDEWKRGATRQDRELCETAGRLIGPAFNAIGIRSSCLKRAMALSALLRSEGIPAEIVLGVRSDESGFRSHAWLRVPSCDFSWKDDCAYEEAAVL